MSLDMLSRRDCRNPWQKVSLTADPLGVLADDVVSIGTLTRSVNIAVISELDTAVPLPWWPSDGILGFARQHDEIGSSFDSSIVELAKGAGAPIVSLFAGDASKNQAGVLTLAGPDPRNCYSNWTRLTQVKGKVTDIWSWNVKVNRLQFGNYASNVPVVAGFGSQAKTRVPSNVLTNIAVTIGAEYDFASDDFVVDCSKRNDFPDLVLSLGSPVDSSGGSFEYRISASSYVDNMVPRRDKKCTLLLHDVNDDQTTTDFVFGWPMHEGHCWMFDYGAKELAFVKSKN